MFNFFKKKVLPLKLDFIESAFIEAIVNSLSTKYPSFKSEWELKTFVGVGKNPGGSKGSFTYFIDNDSWKKICNPSLDNYDVKNIKFKTYNGNEATIDLFISEGLIIGYDTNIEVKDIDVATIDVTNIWEKHFLNKDYSEIEDIISVVSKSQLKKLNLVKNTFRIDINSNAFYPIHDIGNGNYFSINKKGEVFKITHDPFGAKKVFNSVSELLNSILE